MKSLLLRVGVAIFLVLGLYAFNNDNELAAWGFGIIANVYAVGAVSAMKIK